MDKDTGIFRCWPVDPVSKFTFKYKDAGVTSHISSYFGEKLGYGDLRGVSKEMHLSVGLELKVLKYLPALVPVDLGDSPTRTYLCSCVIRFLP